MSHKSKGSNAERDLVKMFWAAGWAAMRAAGSGSTPLPCPDIIAGKGGRILAIECKATLAVSQYFERREIDELVKFASIMGAEAWLAVKFFRQEWVFFSVEDVKETGKSFVVNKAVKNMKGLSFEELVTAGAQA